jgi:hypothetical protein
LIIKEKKKTEQIIAATHIDLVKVITNPQRNKNDKPKYFKRFLFVTRKERLIMTKKKTSDLAGGIALVTSLKLNSSTEPTPNHDSLKKNLLSGPAKNWIIMQTLERTPKNNNPLIKKFSFFLSSIKKMIGKNIR